MATNRFYSDKIGCRLTRASNAETQLPDYIAWQWDRYLIPQNIFLVIRWNRCSAIDFACSISSSSGLSVSRRLSRSCSLLKLFDRFRWL